MPLDRSIEISDTHSAHDPWDLTPEKDEGPTFRDVAGSALRQGNEFGAYFSSHERALSEAEYDEVQDGFNSFDAEHAKRIPEGFEDRFIEVSNDKQFNARVADIEREQEDRRNLDASGWTGTGLELAANVLSPTSLIPGGAIVKGSRAGFSIVKSTASVGFAAAGATALQETALYRIQQTKTGAEVATAIGGSTILGGLLGAAGARLFSKAEFAAVSKALEEDLLDDTLTAPELADSLMVNAQSAGAAAAAKVNPEDLKVAGPNAAKKLAKATAAVKLNPGLELLHSPSDAVKRVFLRMSENAVQTEGEAAGRSMGPAAETVIIQYSNRQAKFVRDLNQIYSRGQKAGMNLKKDAFKERVAMAARRGDVDPLGNEFVTEAARKLRSDILDPAKVEAIRVGLLPEGVTVNTATSYLHRIWNTKRVVAEAPEFKRVVREFISDEIAKAVAEGRGVEFVSKSDAEEYADEITERIFNNITGLSRAESPDWIVPAKRGPLKERVFNIPDEAVERFLENDVEAVSEIYTRKIAPDIELTRSFGSADMRDALKEIEDDYAKLIDDAKSPEQRTKLSDRKKRDIKIVEAFRDLLRHNYKPEEASSDFGYISRQALAWNYLRLLGGQVLGSLPDAALVLTKRGVGGFMQDAMPALVSGTKAARVSKSDAKDFFSIAETVHGARQANIADLTNPYAHGRAGDRLMENVTAKFSQLSGINFWNATMTEIVAVHTTNKIAKTILEASEDVSGGFGRVGGNVRYDKLSKHKRGYLGQLGIPEDLANRVRQQMNRFGTQEGGVWGLDLGKWTDTDAQRVVIAAIQKEIRSTVIQPGVSDRPLWARSNLGKLVTQFKSHALASHQRILISGLQGRPRHLAEYIVASTSLGMFVAYGKLLEKGDYEGIDRLTRNYGLWIAEGIDRAGYISVFMEGSNTIEKWGAPFGITTAFQAIAGDEDRNADISRYSSRGKFAAIAGPTFGLFEDLVTIASEVSQRDLSKRGANAALTLIPGATLPGVRTFAQTEIKPALQDAVE